MMFETRRYRMTLEYDGTGFVGWQIQSNGRSVQEVLETALADLFGIPVRVTGAGRTDAGVHAAGQAAHFDVATKLSPTTIHRAVNARLPADVTVLSLDEAPEGFHARFSASSRTYIYTVRRRYSPLRRHVSWYVCGRLDRARMQDAAALIPGTHRFTALSKHRDARDAGYCHVFEAVWIEQGEELVFRIRANRFLHGMVRAIVGALVRVGRGKFGVDAFRTVLEGKNAVDVPLVAPAQGLVLLEVRYDMEERELVRVRMEQLGKTMGGNASMSC
ncbi:MAG: tRNA pseudouridine(38-40) synthase TruA [Bacteroidota bacterium]|nr:tRNA pseudouridine(38-40) synthase TruA [Bacteroidota bacterium]